MWLKGVLILTYLGFVSTYNRSVSHLFTVCFVFHQVHLPIAPFPNDPDESVIIHHSSKRFITRPETPKVYRTGSRQA